jgi:ring-1,2-phenylacetyl-CoA epoxidase subunit PaaB
MVPLKSLDPRVNRLEIPSDVQLSTSKAEDDQLITFQVFHQMRPGKAFQHVGIVHATDVEMGFIYAKEVFSRRQTCSGLWIIDTHKIMSSEVTEGDTSVYDRIDKADATDTNGSTAFEIFHLEKRGKQHIHAGTVQANDYQMALKHAKNECITDKVIYNIWVAKVDDFYRSDVEDRDIWNTLSDKKYREPVAYKAGDKLKIFLEKNRKS